MTSVITNSIKQILEVSQLLKKFVGRRKNAGRSTPWPEDIRHRFFLYIRKVQQGERRRTFPLAVGSTESEFEILPFQSYCRLVIKKKSCPYFDIQCQNFFSVFGRSSGQLDMEEVVHKARAKRGLWSLRYSVHYAGPFCWPHWRSYVMNKTAKLSKDGPAIGGGGGRGRRGTIKTWT